MTSFTLVGFVSYPREIRCLYEGWWLLLCIAHSSPFYKDECPRDAAALSGIKGYTSQFLFFFLQFCQDYLRHDFGDTSVRKDRILSSSHSFADGSNNRKGTIASYTASYRSSNGTRGLLLFSAINERKPTGQPPPPPCELGGIIGLRIQSRSNQHFYLPFLFRVVRFLPFIRLTHSDSKRIVNGSPHVV